MKLKMLAGGLLVAALGFGAVRLGGEAEGLSVAPSQDALATARRGTLVITVTENGYLKAKNSVNIKPEFSREGTITWLVDEGALVAEGDVLVEFDKSDLETEIDDSETSLIQYQAELESARADLEIQGRENQAAVEKAELQLELKRLALERYLQGEAPNELRKRTLDVEKAESEHQRASESFEKVPALAAEGFLTKAKVEEERIRLREAEINMENAQRELELFQTYTRRMDSTQKQSEVKDAERELENARQKATSNLKEKQALVTNKERQVTRCETSLQKLREEWDHMTIRAPSPGVVHYGDPESPWERENVRVGNQVYQGNTVITLPDLREMEVLIQVHEADIDLVQVGMRVNVTAETHKGQTFTGKVTEIATVASSQSWTDSSNKTFRVKVAMEASEVELRSGVTARTEIRVDAIPNVLIVPIHAVIAESGKHFCFTVAGGEVARRDVSVGRHNSHYVQVTDGLTEGEQLLLYDPRRAGQRGGDTPGAEPEAPADAEEPATGPAAALAGA